jgi:hypothetical protein
MTTPPPTLPVIQAAQSDAVTTSANSPAIALPENSFLPKGLQGDKMNSPEMDVNGPLEIANEEAGHGRGWIAAVVSGVALVGSLFSMWETTLKQPQISFYVSENIQYTRDPYVPSEVLAVPVTIVNDGARDGAVLSMQLTVKNVATGRSEKFKSAYIADAQYFGGRDDVAARIKRPKVPFAPLSVAGRSAYTGTILFYRIEGGEKNLIEASSQIEMTISLVIPPASNQIDRLLSGLPDPVSLKADVPFFYPGAMTTGENAPLKVTYGAL